MVPSYWGYYTWRNHQEKMVFHHNFRQVLIITPPFSTAIIILINKKKSDARHSILISITWSPLRRNELILKNNEILETLHQEGIQNLKTFEKSSASESKMWFAQWKVLFLSSVDMLSGEGPAYWQVLTWWDHFNLNTLFTVTLNCHLVSSHETSWEKT